MCPSSKVWHGIVFSIRCIDELITRNKTQTFDENIKHLSSAFLVINITASCVNLVLCLFKKITIMAVFSLSDYHKCGRCKTCLRMYSLIDEV